jgi:hypothetical protein
LLRKQSELV